MCGVAGVPHAGDVIHPVLWLVRGQFTRPQCWHKLTVQGVFIFGTTFDLDTFMNSELDL